MVKIFQYNDVSGLVELNTPEILLIEEFRELMNNERNICTLDKKGEKKLRAFREFTYIWLAIDWKSIYADYSERERHEAALKDANMSETEFNDPKFRAACRKYRDIQDSTSSMQLLKSVQRMVIKTKNYFDNIDVEERDEQTGKPIFKMKDILSEIKSIPELLESVKELEAVVYRENSNTTSIRGGYEEGFED